MTQWYKDSFENEFGEFERVAEDLTVNRISDAEWDAAFEKLKKNYKSASMKDLDNSVWSKLKNTDSWEATTIDKINKAISKNASHSGSRDIYAVILEIVGPWARCPIILKYKNDYSLIGGNTRLMACKLIGIKPKVIIVPFS